MRDFSLILRLQRLDIARCTFALALLVALLPTPARAERAEGGEDPSVLWQQGIAQFQQGDYAAALEAFELVYDAARNPAVRYNVAVCHFNLEHWVDARNEFALYLAETDPARINDERRAQIQVRLERIDARVGLIEVRVAQEGAIVTVDGTEVGTSPLLVPWALLPGRYEVQVTLEGYEEFNESVSVVEDGTQTVEVSLSPRGTSAETEPEATEPLTTSPGEPVTELEPERRGLSRAWFAIATSLALSLGIGGVVTGALANRRENEFHAEVASCRGGDDQAARDACDAGRDIADQAESLALATNVLLGSAAAFAVTALVLAFFTDWSSGDSDPSTVSFGLTPLTGHSTSRASGFLLDAAFRF